MFDPALSPKPPPADTVRGESTRMNVSPLDLRQQRFRTGLRGFDRVEVTAFLSAVADDYEQALRETDRLRQDLAKMEAVLNENREAERTLRNTLLTAQRLADEMKEHAEQEGKRIIREAEGRASLLLEKAQIRREDIQRDIDALGLKRREVETSIEASIQTLRNTLQYLHDRAEREGDDKILLHRPRQSVEPLAEGDHAALDSREAGNRQ
jgi:cell division initiation protein